MFINECRNVVADIEDEPDGDKSGNAVKVNLHEISNDVPIEKSHCGLNNPVLISVLQLGGSANRNRRNTEIRTTKLEGMANVQMTKDSCNSCSPFGFWASFGIRHSSFVICSGHR